MAETANISAAIHKAIATPPPSHPSGLLRDAMYALQALDAVRSAQNFRQGAHETNPLMAPFSHGGAPTMMLGFGLADLMRDHFLRHATAGTKNNAAASQAISNLLGILQTDGNIQRLNGPATHSTPSPPPTPPVRVRRPGDIP